MEVAGEYLSADFGGGGYSYGGLDFRADISDLRCFADGSLGAVVAFDVLEHVADDLKALREVYRVLAPGGTAVFSVPQKDGLETTFEDSSATSPKMRERLFGQYDHLRIYGLDFRGRMEAAGFRVDVVDAGDFPVEDVVKWVLAPLKPSKHPLATNHRRIYFGQKLSGV
ncbi:Methyltransferase domain protein [uncultured archaeon]|nr:Methyltransferase domain protein [uncultured archaeon]